MTPNQHKRALNEAKHCVLVGLNHLLGVAISGKEDEHVGAAIQSLQDAHVMIGAALEKVK